VGSATPTPPVGSTAPTGEQVLSSSDGGIGDEAPPVPKHPVIETDGVLSLASITRADELAAKLEGLKGNAAPSATPKTPTRAHPFTSLRMDRTWTEKREVGADAASGGKPYGAAGDVDRGQPVDKIGTTYTRNDEASFDSPSTFAELATADGGAEPASSTADKISPGAAPAAPAADFHNDGGDRATVAACDSDGMIGVCFINEFYFS
ncbi:unnamed protein product, partial [Pylaiella littoralis]